MVGIPSGLKLERKIRRTLKETSGKDNALRRLKPRFEATVPCSPSVFNCLNGKCIQRSWFCDNTDDCGDNSDERYCGGGHGEVPASCPSGWVHCPHMMRCIPSEWMCDGTVNCGENSEEIYCGEDVIKVPSVFKAKKKLETWFLQRRRLSSRKFKWGSQVHRIAVALHLANESTFDPGNGTGDEIRYELSLQLLHRLIKEERDETMTSQELALYIHALLVTCIDPKDFYGEDLVLKLRRRVETAGNYTNPFQIIVLCNAGDTMSARDVERVTATCDSHHRLSWADLQALGSMALACIASHTEGLVDKHNIDNMLQELKGQQLSNGTVVDLKTTALVTQTMFIHNFYKKGFDLIAAFQILIDSIDSLQESNSFLHAYYALPILSFKSLLNVTAAHCRKEPASEGEASEKALDADGKMIAVQYSVWIGDKKNLDRTCRLRIQANSTIYDAVEAAAIIDNRLNVKYIIVDGKPFINTLIGVEDDPEMGTYWFIYLKSSTSDEQPKIVEESPVDLKLLPDQEIILWYKSGPWNSPTLKQKTIESD
ncbi:hypothetical protein AVEN_56727-1 [Araneus ventricosus]|uniref:Low-density lipoprotein receptor-related protein 2 n=1 Tax=Araneus ventricosus TaxID=182803 RepID=A0A4Y2KWL1_ARAVE|nr:hypothetical protein AVEN_56727-1 [Araneus ventricosus]